MYIQWTINISHIFVGITASTVEITPIPCSVLNMSFFNKLKDPENGIVHKSGIICKRYDTEIDNFLISDNLRGVCPNIIRLYYIVGNNFVSKLL